jgi:sulfite reductase (NADPH) flavoprotein alpha-component
VGDEAHLAVDVLRHDAHGHAHPGTASGFLATREEGAQVPVFVEPNERFRVPADGSRDIVMIGPAPAWPRSAASCRSAPKPVRMTQLAAVRRAPLRHRVPLSIRMAGRLAPRRAAPARRGLPRDQPEKRYIQHRLREHGRELHAWLQGGAHLYVCGAIGMGKDVHAALVDVIAEHGHLDAEDAAGYLATLQREGRYSRDVY